MKLVLASNNPGKITELSALLSPFPIELISQTAAGVEEVEETGLTFVENALLKARHAAKVTGLPAIADDSGLAVDILHGAPGIYSARYLRPGASAQENNQRLLEVLKDVPDEKRTACFHCVLVLLLTHDDPTPIICDGIWHGTILREPRGAHGFGYDPLFYVASENKTAAELPRDIKNKLSHRGNALQLLLSRLPDKLHEYERTLS